MPENCVTVRTIGEAREWRGRVAASDRVGFVPTMGALHAGHRSLIDTARTECAKVIVSIFVNPTQFGPTEDYDRYPRTFAADEALCREAGVDMIFAPDAAEMYPPGNCTSVEVSDWQDRFEGASRPGHFRGVCTVVAKLFHILQPDIAYFGQKDAQQLRIIEQMVHDLDFPVTIRALPTVREADGLACSSRNRYLSAEERQSAPRIYQTLVQIRDWIQAGESAVSELQKRATSLLTAIPTARLDYLAFLDAETWQPVTTVDRKIIVIVAVYIDKTRLIDNIIIDIT